MKRDIDLIRKILMEIENSLDTSGYPLTLNIPEFPQQTISLHVALLNDAGFIEARCTKMHDFVLWDTKPYHMGWL